MPSTMMSNPLQALLRGPSSSPGGASSPPPGASPQGGGLQQVMAKMFAQQQGADPDFMLKQLTTTRQMFAEMIPKAILSVEGLGSDLSAIIPRIEKAIERLKKAAQAQALARPPIGFSAAQLSPISSGPGGAGMMPSGGGMGGGVGGGP